MLDSSLLETPAESPSFDADELHYQERMSLLAESFHGLRGAPGVRPWDQDKFAHWASSGSPTAASRLAAAFVLSVWNGGQPKDGGWWSKRPFRVGRFDPVEAVARWDHLHVEAYLAWCRNPFWP